MTPEHWRARVKRCDRERAAYLNALVDDRGPGYFSFRELCDLYAGPPIAIAALAWPRRDVFVAAYRHWKETGRLLTLREPAPTAAEALADQTRQLAGDVQRALVAGAVSKMEQAVKPVRAL